MGLPGPDGLDVSSTLSLHSFSRKMDLLRLFGLLRFYCLCMNQIFGCSPFLLDAAFIVYPDKRHLN